MVCDFLAFYRIRIDPDDNDLAGLSGPQFFRYATRLPAYDGAVQARLRSLLADREPDTQPSPEAPGAHLRDATPLLLTTDPLLRHFVEYSQAPPPADE